MPSGSARAADAVAAATAGLRRRPADSAVVMMSELGGTQCEPEEAKALHEYLVKGGFLWVDDSWGTYAWEHWVREVRKVFPNETEYPIVEVPVTHSMFHTLFDVKKFP